MPPGIYTLVKISIFQMAGSKMYMLYDLSGGDMDKPLFILERERDNCKIKEMSAVSLMNQV